MDITKLYDVELKALAYDQLAVIEQSQRNIQAINAELTKRAQVKQPEQLPDRPDGFGRPVE